MNVQELITALESMPDDAMVWLSIDDLESMDFTVDLDPDGPDGAAVVLGGGSTVPE